MNKSKKKFVKRIYAVFIIGFLSLMGIRVLFMMNTYKETYNDNFINLEEYLLFDKYEYYINRYFIDSFEYPQMLSDAIPLNNTDDDHESFVALQFTDFWSKTGGLVKYIPLFNRNNKKREAYLILSSGIDGKMDNNVNESDTFYIDNYVNNLNIYNYEYYHKNGEPLQLKKPKFSLISYFFGRKDYIIDYVNGIAYYKMQGRNVMSIDELIEIFEKKEIRRKVFGFKGVSFVDTILNNDNYLFLNYNDYFIKCKMVPENYWGVDYNDTIILAGKLLDYDKEKRSILFVNCLQLNKD